MTATKPQEVSSDKILHRSETVISKVSQRVIVPKREFKFTIKNAIKVVIILLGILVLAFMVM